MAKNELKPEHKVFAEQYVIDWNATRSYQVAYPYSEYDSARVGASRLLTNDKILRFVKSIDYKNYELINNRKEKNKLDRSNDVVNIYLIKCCGTNYYKIGKTINSPKNRMKNMQTSIPFDLELIHSVSKEQHSKIEVQLHKEYDMFSVRGEWFCFSDKQLKEVINKIDSI